MKRKPPIGSEWRILAHGINSFVRVDIRSNGYDRERIRLGKAAPGSLVHVQYAPVATIFDELVLRLGDDFLHLEQMNASEWCLMLGDEIRILTVRKGKLIVGEMYK